MNRVLDSISDFIFRQIWLRLCHALLLFFSASLLPAVCGYFLICVGIAGLLGWAAGFIAAGVFLPIGVLVLGPMAAEER